MEDFISLIRKRRTIRQFQPQEVPLELLFQLADLGRLAPSASNLQPLEFLVVNDDKIKGSFLLPALGGLYKSGR
jgi:nitroreductase